MKTFVPKYIADTLAALSAERQPLQARMDALDLAIDNLRRLWPVQAGRQKAQKTAKSKPPKEPRIRPETGTAAAIRRELLLSLIGKAPVGLSAGELRKQTPKMDTKDRGNALQLLKLAGSIRRAGNAWVKAA